MRVVVTSTGEGLDSRVDPRFGRAAKLALYDTESGELRVFDNAPNMDLPQGAGIQAAAMVARLGASCLLTGHCGPKAFQTLAAAGVSVVVGADGTVREALDKLESGELAPASAADVDGHW